jgi:hypothetical protein
VGLMALSVALDEGAPEHADDVAVFDVRFRPQTVAPRLNDLGDPLVPTAKPYVGVLHRDGPPPPV